MAKAKTKQQLTVENDELRARLQEMEDTLEAIRSGAVDAIVASGPAGDRVYTLEGADHAYYVMVESMIEGAVTILTDGTILYGNRQFGQMTGASHSEIIGRPFHDFVPASDRLTLSGFIHQAVSSGLKAEMRLRNESAAEIPVQISATPIDLGGTKALALVVTDLSERRRYEEIVAAERLSRYILEQSLEGVAVCVNGRILFASRRLHEICGRNPLLQPFDRLFPLRLSESEPFSVEIPPSGKVVKGAEVSYQNPDGKSYTLILNAGPLYGDDHQILGSLVSLTDITERKQAEERLRESEIRFREMAETISEILFIARPDGSMEYVNERGLDYAGLPVGEVMGDGWLQVVHPQDVEWSIRSVAESLRTGQPYEVKQRLRAADGSYRWFLARARTIRDEKGEILKWFGNATDIHGMMQAEEALRASEEKYRDLFENMAEEVHFWQVVKDEAGRIKTWRLVEANPPTLKTWGRQTVDEIRGKTTDEIFGPGATEHYMPVVQKIMTEGVSHSYEDYFPHLDKYFHFTSVPLGDHFITTGADITGIKKAEEALSESRQRLAVIVDSIADGFYALDRSWRFTHVNDAALRHMGKTREEILGRTLFDAYPESRDSLVETEYARAMESGEARHFKNPSLITGRILEIHAYPGSEILTVLFRDVTEQTLLATALRESEESLRLANEHLEQRVRERTMDLQILTGELERSRHELRSLVSELVMAEERERKRIAGVLHDEIAQTLAAARMRLDLFHGTPSDQRDMQTLQEVKTFLAQSIQETRALMSDIGNPLLFDMGLKAACESLAERLMKRHPVRILCEIRDAFKNLDPDVKTILYQLVRELLTNVVKHSQARNAHVLIDLEDGHFHVKVADDGVGFDPRTLGAPTLDGGFGLYSIRERLLAINGNIGILSDPGTGTVVTATVPAAMK